MPREGQAYVPALDGLRALAVLAVFCFHEALAVGGGWASGGFLGVDLFFVLSGYLITRNLLAEYDATQRLDILRFYRRRVRRLGPALLGLLATLVALDFALQTADRTQTLLAAAVSLAGVMNWFRAFGGPSSLLSHLWSLSAEEQFYLVWPLALWGLLRFAGVRRAAIVLAALVVAIGLWRFALWRAGAGELRIYHGLDTRADGLLLGSLVALAPSAVVTQWARKLWPAFALALLLMVSSVSWQTAFLYCGGFTLVTLCGAGLVAGSVAGAAGQSVVASVPLVWLGKRSYSFYLWHFPIVSIVGTLGLAPVLTVALSLVASLMMAQLSYVLLEAPVFAMRKGLRRETASGTPAG